MALTAKEIEAQLFERGAIADIGQIDAAHRRWLDKNAKAGALIKYRGRWDSLHPSFGIGPLKSCWALPELADAIAPFTGKRA